MGVSNFHAYHADGSLIVWFFAPDQTSLLFTCNCRCQFCACKKLARRASSDRIGI